MKVFVRTSVAGTGQEGDPRRPDLGGLENEKDVHFSMYDEEPDDDRCMARVTAPEDLMEEISAVGEVTVIEDEEAEKVLNKHTPHANLEDLDQPDVEVDDMINESDPEDVLSRNKLNRARLIQQWTRKVPRNDRHDILEENGARRVGVLAHKLSDDEMKELFRSYDFKNVSELPQDTSTIVRSSVALPSRGRRVLQDQEFHAIRRVAEKKQVKRVAYVPEDGHVLARDGSTVPTEVKSRVNSVLDGRNREHQELVDWLKDDKDDPQWMHSI